MIQAVLIDDEIDSIRILQRLLETYCPDVTVVGQADGVETGIPIIQTAKPDLVLLDIEMTQGNTFDLLNQQDQKYHKGWGGNVIMEDGSSIEVASRRREEFLRRLLK